MVYLFSINLKIIQTNFCILMYNIGFGGQVIFEFFLGMRSPLGCCGHIAMCVLEGVDGAVGC